MTLNLVVYVTRDLKFWPTDPLFCGESESELRSRFRARNGELNEFVFQERKTMTLRSGVLDQNKLNFRIPRTQIPNPHL